ncbi:hypothetical protein MUB23_04670 [Cuneatibacter sp. NSJ-177]|uniref:hypothetical protein n=1 Tax=Cuneatibacter sp. NSJ-177 TaxID=2931401 RepID=UPI001FD5BF26|nr:hypothetical protein [Cuneatibacter sp. NSJ-177]MCJ7834684.1 hypothetical protein [Cuneatibacter sp. NSJ-177]
MSDFEKLMHRYGRIYGWAMLLAISAFPVMASIYFGIWPDLAVIWPGVLTMWILMASYVLSEMIAFPPILGPGSLYLTYITGNLQNQKIPCALSAMSVAGIETGTEKANAVSVVAVAVSSITTTIIIALGILLMTPLKPVLNSEFLAPAFNNVVPAIFGALAGMWFLKEVKVSVASILICILGLLVLKIDMQWVLLGGIVLTVLVARGMYQAGIIGKEKETDKEKK